MQTANLRRVSRPRLATALVLIAVGHGLLQCLPLPAIAGHQPWLAFTVDMAVMLLLASLVLAWAVPSSTAEGNAAGGRAVPADRRPLECPAERLIEIANRTTNAIAITDARRRIEWLNPAFEALYGYRLDDLQGRTLRDVIVGGPADRDALARLVAAMEQGRSATAEISYRHRNGPAVISRVEVIPLRDAAGGVNGFMGIHEDVTSQRAAERALRASETQFRLLTEAAPILAWIEDEHGSCQWFNDQWLDFVGRDLEQDQGDGWLDNVHPDDREHCQAASRQALAGRTAFESTYRLRRHDGVYRQVLDRGVPRWDETGRFLGFVGAVMDVTPLEEKQRLLVETRNYLADAIESIDGGVIMLDAEDRIVMCNQRYLRMFDLSELQAVPGSNYRQQVLDYYRANPDHCESLSPEAFVEKRWRHHRCDGVWEKQFGERWIQIRERTTRSGGVVSLRLDVTGIKRTEAALRERQEFLELALHATNDGLWDWNLQSNELYFSPRFHELLGYENGLLPTTLEGWIKYLHPTDRTAIVKVMRRAQRRDQQATAVEYRCLTADGSYRWFVARGMVVHDEFGRARRSVGSISDIHDRKCKELELVQARQLLQDAIDSVDGGLVMFDASDRLVFCNRRYRDMYNFTDHEVTRGTCLSAIARAFYTRNPQCLNGLTVEQKTAQRMAHHRGPQSAWEMGLGDRWYQVNDRMLADGSVISLRTDITALKAATGALEERRELLEILVHASNDGLWDWNIEDGSFYASPRLKQLLGYRDDEFGHEGPQWVANIHPDDRAHFEATVRAHLTQGAPFDIDHRTRTRTGEWRWFHTRAEAVRHPDGQARRVAGSTSDVHEQKLSEIESQTARQLLHEAIEAMDAGIVRFDAGDRILFCNERYRAMYGLPPTLVVPGTHFRDILHYFFTQHPEVLGRLTVDEFVDYRFGQHRQCHDVWEQKLGQRWVLVSDRLAADGGIVSLRTDITNFKRIETDLSLAKSRAEAANVAKTRFLANVSHELRTPLNGVIGMLQMMDQSAIGQPYADYVELALRSGRALLDLINDLLDSSKIEAGKLELERVDFDLVDLIADARALMATAAVSKGLALDVLVDPQCPRQVSGDPTRLRQILTNLLGNAVKFTAEGGVRLHLCPGTRDGYLLLEVRDTGIGIAPDLQQQIFEPFTQADAATSRQFGGTGLGLTICRNLVRLMGGELVVESRAGEGSVFRFEILLPAATAGTTAGPAKAAVTAGASPLPPARVLLVDDMAVNLQVAAAMLKRLGLAVDSCQSGDEALLAAGAQRYDLIFMDCQMPGMDGYATTHALQIRLGTACPPIVAMTANAGAKDRARCRDAGMVDFLTKPVDLAALQSLVQRLLCAPSASPVGDDRLALDTFESLRGSLGDAAFEALLEVFISTVTARIDSLELAWRTGELATVRRLAHAITGVSGNVGAAKLASLVAAIEAETAQAPAFDAQRIEALRAALGDVSAAFAAQRVAA